jgi:hypothetical protein
MSRKLILGIISQKPELIEQSTELYQRDVLFNIRQNIDPKRIFGQVKKQIHDSAISASDTVKMLDRITDKNYSNHAGLGEIAGFLKAQLEREAQRSLQEHPLLVAKTSRRTIDLSISYGKYGCCAFWGVVEQEEHYRANLDSRYHASTLYLADPEIGLLFHYMKKENIAGSIRESNPDIDDKPVGVIILADLLGSELDHEANLENKIKPNPQKRTQERILLVDSIEAYRPAHDSRFPDNPLRSMKNDTWRRLTYNSLFEIAKDIGASKILYNTDFWNEGGNTFTNYLLKRLSADAIDFKKDARVALRKEGGRKFIPPYYKDGFGFFLDSLIPHDSEHFTGVHAIKGNYDGSGTATGILIKV